MRKNQLTESFVAGFKASQAGGGGAVAPDSAERYVKKTIGAGNKENNKENNKEKPQKQNTAVNAPKTKQTSSMNLPTGVSRGNIMQIKKGDQVSYTTGAGSAGTGTVLNVVDDSQLKIKQGRSLLTIKSKDIAQVNDQDWKLREQTYKDSKMNNKKVNEDLAELAGVAEKDHEVQMARADLYKIAKYAIKLHEMLKGVSESQGLEGWQQAKITKAADYISSVYHNLDYDLKFKEQLPQGKLQISDITKESTDPYKKKLAEKLAKKIA